MFLALVLPEAMLGMLHVFIMLRECHTCSPHYSLARICTQAEMTPFAFASSMWQLRS